MTRSTSEIAPNPEDRVPSTESRVLDPESRTPDPGPQTPSHESRSPSRKILAIVEDLFFLAKIREAARQSGIELEVARPETLPEKLAQLQFPAVILDLNHRSGRAIEAIQAIKENTQTQHVPVLGFLSHVQGDLAARARASGCDVVMARSAFSVRLPEILRDYSSR